jgi:hypothetical protein
LNEVAVVREASHGRARVFSIDGESTYGAEWHLVPGLHEIWIKAEIRAKGGTFLELYNYCLLHLEAAAGSTYDAEAGGYVKEYSGGQTSLRIGSRIVEISTGEITWPIRCVARRPRTD